MATEDLRVRNQHSLTHKTTSEQQANMLELQLMGDVAFSQKKYERALTCYLEAEKLVYPSGNHVKTSILLASIASTYVRMHHYLQAEAYYLLAAEEAQKKQTPPTREVGTKQRSKKPLFIFLLGLTVWIFGIFSTIAVANFSPNASLLPSIELFNVVLFETTFFSFFLERYERRRRQY